MMLSAAAVPYLISLLVLWHIPLSASFNVGVGSTKCNLDPAKGELNDPCLTLYAAVCGGSYCKCPAGTHEDKALGTCKPGAGPPGSRGEGSASAPGGAFDDLPFDFDPSKPDGGGGGGAAPKPDVKPDSKPTVDRPGQHNPNAPPYSPNVPYNPNAPYNPPYNPNAPYSPNQPRPGYNPNQPGYNPNQPGYSPNQPKRPPAAGGGDPHLGEKAGGGTGGVIGLLLLGALIYFCCFKGKGKGLGGKFQNIPFIGGRLRGQPPSAGADDTSSYPMNDPNFVPNDPNQQQMCGPHPQPGYPGGPPHPGDPNAQPPIGFYPGQLPPPPYVPQYQPGGPPPTY